MTIISASARRRAGRRLAYSIAPLHLIVDGAAEGLRYGFPGFTILPNGDWYVVCRRATGHNPTLDPASFGSIVAFKSTNAGATWSGPTVIQSDPLWDLRDPTLTTLSDGRIAVHYFSYDASVPRPHECLIAYSSDGGATWTTPTALPYLSYKWNAVSGPIVERIPGELWGFAYAEIGGVRSVTSTDNGATWTTNAAILTGTSYGTQEPYAQIRPDGRIEVHLRGVAGIGDTKYRRRIIRNNDGTWTAPEIFSWAARRPSWAVNPITGHRLANDRIVEHSWTIAPDVDTMRLDPADWTPYGGGGSEYEQPQPYGMGFVSVMAKVVGGGTNLYWTRWDLNT